MNYILRHADTITGIHIFLYSTWTSQICLLFCIHRKVHFIVLCLKHHDDVSSALPILSPHLGKHTYLGIIYTVDPLLSEPPWLTETRNSFGFAIYSIK